MKSFREFLSEEMLPYAQTEKGFVGVDNGPVRDNINIHLASITAKPYATPYHAMEMVRKVLAPFSIFPPSTNFLDGDSGHEIFEINQFGDKMGMTNDGEVVVKIGSPYYVYFEWAMNDTGSFDIFCEIVNNEELDEIMSDIEAEMEDGDMASDEMSDAEDSFDSYKAKNQENEMNEETISEVSKQLASKASEKAYEKGSEYYDSTTKLRGKALKSKDKKDMDAATAEQGKMSKKWKQSMKFKAYADKKMEESKDDLPFDMPTEKPSTPYKNPAAKSKQLARAAMRQIQKGKEERKRLRKSLREK